MIVYIFSVVNLKNSQFYMASHVDLGKNGELLAIAHLRTLQYQVLETNWKDGRREIDIIARDGDCLVFVEVKSRSYARFAWPEMQVNESKRLKIQSVAERYMERMLQPPRAIRFDIVAITFKPVYELMHFKDAF
jgi:putative endonuclease